MIKRDRAWWDKWFLDLASQISTASKDPSTKIGAIVVGKEDRRKVAFGYNGFPPGVSDTPERLRDRAVKYRYVVHAERNALDNATFDPVGGTLYCTTHPCRECVKSILSRRIARVVTRTPPIPEPGRWTEEIPDALELLEEGGVEVTYVP